MATFFAVALEPLARTLLLHANSKREHNKLTPRGVHDGAYIAKQKQKTLQTVGCAITGDYI